METFAAARSSISLETSMGALAFSVPDYQKGKKEHRSVLLKDSQLQKKVSQTFFFFLNLCTFCSYLHEHNVV